MARQINVIAGVFVALIISAVGTARAQDCPRGDLDKAYCDRDGDLVADTPTDPKQLVNPSTLIFAYTPVEDPAVYQSLGRLHQARGKGHRQKGRVLPGPVERSARSKRCAPGRLHIAGFNTGGNPHRGQLRGLRAVRDDGRQGRQLSATRWKSSCRPTVPIKTPADLKGKKLASPRQPRIPASRRRRRCLKSEFQS